MKRPARDRDQTQSTDSTRVTVDTCEPHLGPLRDDLATDDAPPPTTVRNRVPVADAPTVPGPNGPDPEASTLVDAAPITLRMLPVEAPRTVRLQLPPFAATTPSPPMPASAAADVRPPAPAPLSMLTMASAADPAPVAKRKSGPPPLPVEVLAEPAVIVRPSISAEALERHARTGPRLVPVVASSAPPPSVGPRSVRPARERAPRRAQLLHGLVAAMVAAALLVMGVSIVLLTPSGKAEPSASLVHEDVQHAPIAAAPEVSATVVVRPTGVAPSVKAPEAAPTVAAAPASTARTIVLSSPTLVVGAKAPKAVHSAPPPTPLAPAAGSAPTPLPEPTRLGVDLK